MVAICIGRILGVQIFGVGAWQGVANTLEMEAFRGFLMAPAVWGVSSCYPALMLEGKTEFRLESVVALSILAGAFNAKPWKLLN
jgi:hypothetical protein